MKKSLVTIVFLLFVAGITSVYARQLRLNTEADSLSYALGLNIGSDLKMQLQTLPAGDINTEVFLQSLSNALRGGTALMDRNDAMSFLEQYFFRAQEREIAENREEGIRFLAENGRRAGVTTTASGLQYEIIVQGSGARPTRESVVRVHYTGTTIDGNVFDSSVQRGEPTEFPLTRVIEGWTEALQLMPVGSRWRIFLPYHLAYGEHGAGGIIQPFSALIFEVELIDIVN